MHIYIWIGQQNQLNKTRLICEILWKYQLTSFCNMSSKDTIVNIVSPRRKWISLAILFFVNLLNYMDRYTVSAVLDVSKIYTLRQSS